MTLGLSRLVAFPLLGKELVEMAARPRTYAVRVVYALLLFGFFFEVFSKAFAGPSYGSLRMMMGTGGAIFQILVDVQFAGIFLFLPALMCGAVTREKERDSLVILFLTDLRPWEVLLQKYAGGLMPMGTFLLLSLPLGAVAYSFGGMSSLGVALGVTLLLLCCLQVGAITIMFSAWCRTTVGAFLCSYFFGALFYVVLPIGLDALGIPAVNYSNPGLRLTPYSLNPAILFNVYDGFRFAIPAISSSAAFAWCCLPAACSTVVFLLLARWFLVRRAFAPPGQLLLKIFRGMDGCFKRWNTIVGGVSFGRERLGLPADDPIIWRELTRKPMGTFRYLVRLFVPVEFLVVALGMFLVAEGAVDPDESALAWMMALLWLLAIVAVSVQAANVIVSERVHQTLDVLLTTPLRAADIVRQKARAPRRMVYLCWVPFFTVIGLEVWTHYNVARDDTGLPLYLVCSVLSLLIYLPLFMWISLWAGLKLRTRFRAILAALGMIFVWCSAQAATLILFGDDMKTFLKFLVVVTGPAVIVALNETEDLRAYVADELPHTSPWTLVIVSFTFHAALLFAIRHLCLTRAGKYLRQS